MLKTNSRHLSQTGEEFIDHASINGHQPRQLDRTPMLRLYTSNYQLLEVVIFRSICLSTAGGVFWSVCVSGGGGIDQNVELDRTSKSDPAEFLPF